jgi:hypothetical protein
VNGDIEMAEQGGTPSSAPSSPEGGRSQPPLSGEPKRRKTASPPPGGGGLLAIIERLANLQAPPIEVIERLLAQRRIEEDRAAERAFNAALSKAKAKIEPVLKTHDVDFASERTGKRTRYKYEEFADVARAVDPVFADYGLAYRFNVWKESNVALVVTVLSHADGHSVTSKPLDAVIDAAGSSMNPLQALGSALTYLQRYGLRAAIGLAAGRDDDAQSLNDAADPVIDLDNAIYIDDLIRETKSDKGKFLQYVGAESVQTMTKAQFDKGLARLKAKQHQGK